MHAPRRDGPAGAGERAAGRIRGAAALLLLAAGCGAQPATSFETIGVPEPERVPGRAAVILGWAREQRQGWSVRSVLVDGRRVRGWDPDSQAPVVMYLPPGRRSIGLTTRLQSGGADGRARLFRPRHQEVDVAAGEVHLCVVRVGERAAGRPSLRCMTRVPASVGQDPGEAAAPGDDRAPSAAPSPIHELFGRSGRAAALSELVTSPYSAPAAADEPGSDPGDGRAEASLEQLDARLRRLERLVEGLLLERGLPRRESAGPAAPGAAIDTSPPW